MRKSVLLILLFLFPQILSADDYKLNPNIDIQHYKFELTLNDDSNNILGRTTIKVYYKSGTTSRLVFDLISYNAGENKGMKITSVKYNGENANYNFVNDKISISLLKPQLADSYGEVIIEYNGVPFDGLVIGKNLHGERVFFGDNWPNRARQWLPTLDHPSDKATNEFIITAPNSTLR